MDLHIGTVRGSQRHCTIQHEFHVTGSAGFLTCQGYLFRYITGGNQLLCVSDIVIFHHQYFHKRRYIRVIVDDFLQYQQQVDDVLCNHISRRRFGSKDKCNRSCRLPAALNLQIFVDNIQRIHLLTLILMHSLDLDIKNSVGIQFYPFMLCDISHQLLLLFPLNGGNCIQNSLIITISKQFLQFTGILLKSIPNGVGQKLCQFPVTGKQPSAESDAICLVIKFVRINLIKMMKFRLFQNISVDSSHAIDGKTIMDIDVGHVHSLFLIDNLHLRIRIHLADTYVQGFNDRNQLRNSSLQVL